MKLLLGALLFILGVGVAQADTSKFLDLHREFKRLVNGDPTLVALRSSKELCDLSVKGAWRFPDTEDALEKYYFDTGECSNTYKVNLQGIYTAMATGGVIEGFFFDQNRLAKVGELLTKMQQEWPSDIDTFAKLDIQQTLWEFIQGLDFRRDIKPDSPKFAIDQNAVNSLLKLAMSLMDRTLFDSATITSKLRADINLSLLPSQDVKSRWLGYLKSNSIVEDVFPGRAHSELSGGRIFVRVFLTSDSEVGKAELRDFLSKRGDPIVGISWGKGELSMLNSLKQSSAEDLSLLPQHVSDVRTILVAFFGVLDKNYKVQPTNVVASWKEVSYKEKQPATQNFLFAHNSVSFLDIAYAQNFDSNLSGPIYQVVNDKRAVRAGIIDATPLFDGVSILSHRANCFSCHAFRVRSYWFHMRKVAFQRPFLRSNPDFKYINKYGEKAEELFSRINALRR